VYFFQLNQRFEVDDSNAGEKTNGAFTILT